MSEPYDFFASPSGQPNQPAQQPAQPSQPAQPVPGAPQADRFGGYGAPAPGAAQAGYGSPQFGAHPYAAPPMGYPAAPGGLVGGAYPYGRPVQRSAPGVTIAAAVMTFISAGFCVLGALGALAAGAAFGSFASASGDGGVAAGIGVFLAIVLGAFAGLYVLIGRGLLTGRSWASTTAIVLSSLALGLAALTLIGGDIFSAACSAAWSGALLFLLLRPASRAWFAAGR